MNASMDVATLALLILLSDPETIPALALLLELLESEKESILSEPGQPPKQAEKIKADMMELLQALQQLEAGTFPTPSIVPSSERDRRAGMVTVDKIEMLAAEATKRLN